MLKTRFENLKKKTMFMAFSLRDSDLTGFGCGPSIILVFMCNQV